MPTRASVRSVCALRRNCLQTRLSRAFCRFAKHALLSAMRLHNTCLEDTLPLLAAAAAATLSRSLGSLWACVVALIVCVLVKTAAAFKRFGRRRKERHHTFKLHTVRVSHFSEKVRWALQLSGAAFEEEADVGMLNILLTARMVPRLRIQPPDGPAYEVSGSAECISALHGALERDGIDSKELAWLRYQQGDCDLERQIDKLGYWIQHVVYSELMNNKADAAMQKVHDTFLQRVWGFHDASLPLWQRWVAAALFPFSKGFMRKVRDMLRAPSKSVLRCNRVFYCNCL